MWKWSQVTHYLLIFITHDGWKYVLYAISPLLRKFCLFEKNCHNFSIFNDILDIFVLHGHWWTPSCWYWFESYIPHIKQITCIFDWCANFCSTKYACTKLIREPLNSTLNKFLEITILIEIPLHVHNMWNVNCQHYPENLSNHQHAFQQFSAEQSCHVRSV